LNCEIDDGSIKSFCSIENDICEYGQCEWTGNPAAAVCHCHAGYTGKYCTKVAVMRNDTREITFLIFVNQSDPEQSTESVEADVLAQLLILEPDADLRNFNLSVIWNGYDKNYVVVLRITASAAVNTTVMLDAIGRHVNDTDSVWQSVTWNIDNEVDTDDDTTDNVSTTSLMLTAILAALVVLVVFLSFYLRVACVRHKRYKYKNDKGEEYVMPT
jgi:hypothetical protein